MLREYGICSIQENAMPDERFEPRTFQAKETLPFCHGVRRIGI